jgi:DNA-binding PadR family transcriptional regulator
MSGVTPSGHEPLTPAVLHVLLALADGPLHGYAVMQRVEEDSGVQMGPGTVYGSIQRLERQGLVREADEDGDARRRPFELTVEGRAALAAEAVRLRRLDVLVRERGVAPGAGPA